jgi:membrane protein involved in colicin uptake
MTDLLNDTLSEKNDFERLSDLRQKVLNGEEISSAEYAQVIESLRKSRTAQPTTLKSGKKPQVKSLEQSEKAKELDDLLGD